jgi:hypothetical protein
MSDQIYINQTPIENNILVNTTNNNNNIDITSSGSLVVSVNGRIGAIVLTKSDVGLENVDNTSDLNKPISNATLSALLLKTDLSLYYTLNDLVTSNYGSWNNVYATVKTLSGNWQTAYQSVSTTNNLNLSSFYWNTAYSLVSGGIISTLSLPQSTAWTSTSVTVSTLSANWQTAYQSVSTTNSLNLSSSYWNTAYSLVSGGIIASFSLPQSAIWNSTSNTVSSLSANWQTAYSIGTTYQTASANWQTAYQSVSTTNNLNLSSSYWNSAYTVATIYQNASATFATNTLLQSTSSLLTPLTLTNNLTSQLVTNINFTSYQTSVANTTATLLPTSIYQNSSGSFATNTLLQSTSALLTPLTLTNTLTSQLVLNTAFNNYQTSVATSTATLLPTSIYQNSSAYFVLNTTINSLTGNWNNSYSNISNLSSTYSAVTGINGTIYQIQAVNNNGVVTLSVPNSFRTLGDLNVGGNLYVAGSGINLTSLTLSVSSPIIYINDSLDGNGNVFDIGLVGHFNNGLYQHTGLVRSAQNNYWSLFSGLTSEPLDNPTLNYNDPTFKIDTLRANILGSLTGNIVGNITGNAATVTNGVYTTVSYSDPSWIVSLADSKISGSNRNSWDSTFITLCSLSANYSSVYNQVYNLSGNWQTAYQSVSTTNSLNLSSSYWNTAYSIGTVYQTASANWQTAYQSVSTTNNLNLSSSYWNTAYQSVSTTNSLNLSSSYWNTAYSIGTTYQTASANWNTAYQSVSTTNNLNLSSSYWNSTFTTVSTLSANWQTAYSFGTAYSNTSALYLPLSGGTMSGALTVNAAFAAQTKSFLIDHPSLPNKKLQYGSLESPYHGIRLTGRDKITSKQSIVQLPNYVKDLVREDDVNIQLTNINHNKVLYVKSIDINNNQFIVGFDKKWTEIFGTYEFFWSFTAIRKDVPALEVEV